MSYDFLEAQRRVDVATVFVKNREVEPVYKLPFPYKFVILAKAGIQCFQYLLDPPVKPEDDKY